MPRVDMTIDTILHRSFVLNKDISVPELQQTVTFFEQIIEIEPDVRVNQMFIRISTPTIMGDEEVRIGNPKLPPRVG